MEKILNPGSIKIGQIKSPVFLRAKISNGTLSISGVIGPLKSGNSRGSCGQIDDTIREAIKAGEFTPEKGWNDHDISTLLDIWDKWHLNDLRVYCEHQKELGWYEQGLEKIKTYQWRLKPEISKKKKELEAEAIERAKSVPSNHSVGFHAQDREILSLDQFITTREAELTGKNLRYYEATKDTYGYFTHVKEETRHWTRFDEDDRGLLAKPCPVCGYKYGTSWRKEALPDSVLETFKYWPVSKKTPAWV